MLTIAEFMRDFHKKLFEIAHEDVKREVIKQERIVKHTLFTVLGEHRIFKKEDAIKFQERFHVRIDQMAADYQTWKRAGCKPYAKPKQYVTGRVAGTSKKAFDIVLSAYILHSKELEKAKTPPTTSVSEIPETLFLDIDKARDLPLEMEPFKES